MEQSENIHRQVSVFLSHVDTDKARVEELEKVLVTQGFVVPKDRSDFSTGQSAVAHLRAVIHKSDFFIVCLSDNSLSNGRLDPKLRQELAILWSDPNTEAFLIPICFDPCGIPLSLQAFPSVDMAEERGVSVLLEAIDEVVLRRRTIASAFVNPVDLDPAHGITVPTVSDGDEDYSVDGPADPTSVRHWRLDLLRLLAGEREVLVQQLGSVEEYVQVMLAESLDPSAARAAFEEGLEMVIQGWQPSVLESDLHSSYALELLASHTPENGFVKVVALSRLLKRFLARRPFDDEMDLRNLYFKTLVTLECYYPEPPRPPTDISGAYQTYVDLLKEELRSPEYCGYVLRRLVQLKVVELGRLEIERLIRLNPQSLSALMKLILDPVRQSLAQNELTLIYMLCLEAGHAVELEFEKSIASCGGRFFRESNPRICFGEACFDLDLPAPEIYQYWEIRQIRESRLGLEKDQNMLAGVTRS